MSDFNPKQGEMILVGEVEGRWMSVPRVFVCLHQGGWLCQYEHDEDRFKVWLYAKPLPTKPEPISFTHETWPKQVVWLRNVESSGSHHGVQMTAFYHSGVCLKETYYKFEHLLKGWEMSLDFCQTWQPCHYVPES